MSDGHDKEHKDQGSHGGSHGGGHGGHGGGGHAEGEHEGAPEWLISFADMVMLIMAFFVIMLAMNMGPKAEPVQGGDKDEEQIGPGGGASRKASFVIAIRNGFKNPIDMKSSRPDEAWLRKHIRENEGAGDREGPPGDKPNQQSVKPSEYTMLGGALVMFEDHSNLLTSTARETVQASAEQLKDQRWIVELRGHVSPWEASRNAEVAMKLSHERAMQVARELIRHGISWSQLRVVACGESDRLVARSPSHADDRRNQRVEIVVTKDLVPPDPYAAPAPPPATPDGG
ncbi:MAG: OmpA family protein [Phycisphaeraceae bacterium]|nr:MAG: OmpA family protein [Phycisphaeraceae bacterium]